MLVVVGEIPQRTEFDPDQGLAYLPKALSGAGGEDDRR